MITNELRNIDIEKIKENPDMKAKRNPIFSGYVDDKSEVFDKFDFREYKQISTGGNNIIYYNKDFIIRISKRILNVKNELYDNLIHLNIPEKNHDELMMRNAIRFGLCPRTYIYSNIKINDKIHRYCVMEAYDTCLCKFLNNKKVVKIMEYENKCYGSIQEILQDITAQIIDLNKRIIDMKIVYYDFKPGNIVLNIDNTTGKITANMIDWDTEFCVKETWLQENKDAVEFLNLLVLAFFLFHYHKYNFLHQVIKEKYSPELFENVFSVLFETTNEYLTVILHYFYRPFGLSEVEKDAFEPTDNSIFFLKRQITNIMLKSAMKFDNN